MEEEIAAWGRTALVGRAYFELTEGLVPAEWDRARRASPRLILLPLVGEWRRPFAMRAVDLEPLLGSGRLSAPEEDTVRSVVAGRGVIASRAFGIQYGLGAGDRAVLTTTGGAHRTEILAVTDRFAALGLDRAFLLVGRRFAEEHLGTPADARPRAILAWSRDGAPVRRRDVQALRQALEPGVRRHATGRGRLAGRLQKTRSDFRIFDAVWAFLAVLALVGTVGTIGLRALERRRELALLRVLGTTRKQFRRHFMAQGLAVGLAGGVLALLLAVPFSLAAVLGLREVSGMDVHFVYSPTWAAACLALAAALGVLAGALAAWRARRLDWAAALKYE
jgi:hypothetical protein